MFLLVETTVKVRLPRLRPSSHTSLDDKNLLPQVFLFCQDLISIINMLSVLTDHSVINKPEHQSSVFYVFFFLVGVQARHKERGGSFLGGLFPGGEGWLGRWHHRCCRQAADDWRQEGDKPGGRCWIRVTQHQSEVSKQLFAHRLCSMFNIIMLSLSCLFMTTASHYNSPLSTSLSLLKQSVGRHVWRPQWDQHERSCGAWQHLQQLFLRWASSAGLFFSIII